MVLIEAIITYLTFSFIFPVNSTNEYHEWIITFYTSNKVFAGTNNEIYLKLIGDYGQSEVIINPSKYQLEAASIDKFRIKIYDNIGIIKELIIGKKTSKKFFSDWYLDKIHVESPYEEYYTFVCNCKITNEMPSHSLKPLNSITAKKKVKTNQNVAFRVTGIVILAIILFCLTILVFTFIFYKMRHIFFKL